jgi:hypothetical protein
MGYRAPKFSPGISQPYNVNDFFATAAMTWTVDLGDVDNFSYSINGKFIKLNARLINTTIGGVVAGANLQLKIPNGLLAARTITGGCLAAPAGAAVEGAIWGVVPGSNIITILRYAANWVLGANNTTVSLADAEIEFQ